jgi:CubicO group peptidase (beta-lactamase class C family)
MSSQLASDIERALILAGAPAGEVQAAVGQGATAGGSWGAMPAGVAVEAGSVTKGVTGLLLSLGDAAGEVSPEDELGRFLDVGGAGRATLAALATHSSGLPRLPPLFALQILRHPRNPYKGYSLERLLWTTRRAPKARAGSYAYSNLGVALLGHALARAAGTDYWTLATERVLRPLGMHRSGSLPDAETWTSGRLWSLEAFGPAGGLRAPVTDLSALARLAADPAGSPLGQTAVDALRPRQGAGHARIGWCWMTSTMPDGDIRWHNGGTGAAWTLVAGTGLYAVAANVATRPSAAYDHAVLRTLDGPDAGGHHGAPSRH